MEKTIRLEQLQNELERLRTELYDAVGEEPSQLKSPQVLPISQQLDVLINEFMCEQQRRSSC